MPVDLLTRRRPVTCARSVAHQERAHAVVPGGAHTYAKGDDQYPEFLPPVIRRGEGCHVVDLDGNRFIEYGSGLRAITLGHGYGPVQEAAIGAIRDGTNFARPSCLELSAAEKMLELVPAAEMVKFGKHGSDCTTAAVKLARSVTGRTKVAVCHDQPFFSVDDWFIGMTDMPGGITDNTRGETVGFAYNDLRDAERVLAGGDVACVVLEGQRGVPPSAGYLYKLRDLCHEHGALFVVDEMIAGFRLAVAGNQEIHDLSPDLSTFGKAMANGFSVSALCGKREYMERGGIRHTDAERVFLLSTTHGAETHALAAFLAAARVYQTEDVIARLHAVGERLCAAFDDASRAAGTIDHVYAAGEPANAVFLTCGPDGRPGSQPFRTLFMQELIRRNVLAPSLVVNLAHEQPGVIERTAEAAEAACRVYARALNDGATDGHLEGASVRPVFRARN